MVGSLVSGHSSWWRAAQTLTVLVAVGVSFAAVGCGKEKAKAPGNRTVIAVADAKVHSQGTQIVDAVNAPLNLRCVNVDSWLYPVPYLISDAGNALFISPSEFAGRLDLVVGADRAASFWRDWRDAFITEADFTRMSALGFNCARLVLYHRAIADVSGSTATLKEETLRRVDTALDWGLKHNVYVVLDLHSAPGGQNGLPTVSDLPSTSKTAGLWEGPEAESNKAATVAIWRGLAERYRDRAAVAGYDLLNEPALPGGTAPALPALYERIVKAVREVDPKHMLFVEGDNLAHDFGAFARPPDENMAYEFHAYALTGFEDWATPETQDLKPYLDLRGAQQRPLWLGEFGEQTKDWQVKVINLTETNNIGWALYPWKRKQTLFWNPVLEMIPPTPKWYALANYLAQPADGKVVAPSLIEAELGMAEVLNAIKLASCSEDGELANAIVRD